MTPRFQVRQRVAVKPHCDCWMQGDRFGTVHRLGAASIRVRLDRSNRLLWFKHEDLSPLVEGESTKETSMRMRMRWEKRGGHVHVRVFTSSSPGRTFAKNGDLVFSVEEWEDLPRLFRNAEYLREVKGRANPPGNPEPLHWTWHHPGSQKTGFWQFSTSSRVYRVWEDEGTWRAANGFESLGRADTEAGARALCEAHSRGE